MLSFLHTLPYLIYDSARSGGFQSRAMSGQAYENISFRDELEDDAIQSSVSHKSNALSNKLTSILSTSFADGEIREALRILDERHTQNTEETRRRLRQDTQKKVIECNGDIIRDFGQVAEVDERGRRLGGLC